MACVEGSHVCLPCGLRFRGRFSVTVFGGIGQIGPLPEGLWFVGAEVVVK